MNDYEIKNKRNGKIISKEICNYDNDATVKVTYDQGMGQEYRRQLGVQRVWCQAGMIIFVNEQEMNKFAAYFSNDGNLSQARPATPKQIAYLNALNVKIENGLTVERASQLIDAAKNNILGSVNGWYTDGSN